MLTMIAICFIGGIVVACCVVFIKQTNQESTDPHDYENVSEEENCESCSFLEFPYGLGLDWFGPSPLF